MSNTHIVYTHTYIIGIGTIERDVTHYKCKQGENKHSPPGMYYCTYIEYYMHAVYYEMIFQFVYLQQSNLLTQKTTRCCEKQQDISYI